jgi:hypothetical protein
MGLLARFEPDIFDQKGVTRDLLIRLTKIGSLSRARAKIQNEYKMFQADEKVRKYRGVLEDRNKTEALEDKPKGMGTYTVFVDETGKTQSYLSVGSLWVLKYSYHIIESHKKLTQWKTSNGIESEFHFSNLTKNKVDVFKEFFLRFLSLHPEVSFKIIVLSNKGLTNKNTAVTDLTYHLINKGVEHENGTGRAPLPRQLSVIVDEEEEGSDYLKLENIKERIISQNIEGLFLGEFKAGSSKENFFIQVVDLFTGAINRKLHNPDSTNFKDEFADFILETLNFDISTIDTDNNQADNSTVFTLR